MQIVEECERHKVQVWIIPDVFQQRMQRVDLDTLHGIPLIGVEPRQLSNSALLVKRAVELISVVVTLPLLLLLFGIIAAMIKLDSPGPVLYRQRRVGKDGQEFDIFKFRSMIHNADELKSDLAGLNEADGPLFKIKADPRMTRVGRWLRRSSVDELPQIINVVRGEMSMVGPRPGTPEEVEQYEPWQRARLKVKPGMTGLWQANGRSDLPFDEGCLLDIYYIENWTLELDLQIVLQTIPRLLVGAGAY
jgi:exopolysaccharide biosynthesis polyprenyl glycosylphosphotransferase